MLRRIEEGTTTVGDKYLVMLSIFVAFLIGIGVGALIVG